MGINVCLYKMDSEQEEHPTWDWVRHSGDRAIPAWISTCDTIEWHELIRPLTDNDFDFLRGTIPPDCPNKQRWVEMLDVLQRQPEYGIYFSY